MLDDGRDLFLKKAPGRKDAAVCDRMLSRMIREGLLVHSASFCFNPIAALQQLPGGRVFDSIVRPLGRCKVPRYVEPYHTIIRFGAHAV